MLRLLLLLAAVLAPVAHAQSATDSTRAAWLADRLVILDDVGSADAFAASVSSARVVALGEATHGDGAAFVLRDTLTRALQRAGFRSVGLEATGLYDLPEVPASAEEVRAAVDRSASWMWRSSAQALPGLRYAAATWDAPDELRLIGIDVQHGPEGGARLLDDIEAALPFFDLMDERWPVVRTTFETLFEAPFAPVDDERKAIVGRAVADYAATIDAADMLTSYGLRSALAHAEVAWQRSMAPRDRQMGANAVGLAEARRMVIWSASSHAVRRLPAIDTLDPDWDYDGTPTMGDGLDQAFGDGYHVVAFTACGGTYGAAPIGFDEGTIGAATPGSVEALVCAAPFETAAYLDLRALATVEGGTWLNAPLVARPLGYTEMRASWPLVLDGLIVIREMTPSTPSELVEE